MPTGPPDHHAVRFRMMCVASTASANKGIGYSLEFRLLRHHVLCAQWLSPSRGQDPALPSISAFITAFFLTCHLVGNFSLSNRKLTIQGIHTKEKGR